MKLAAFRETMSKSDKMDKLTDGDNAESALGTTPSGVGWTEGETAIFSPGPNEGIEPTIFGR